MKSNKKLENLIRLIIKEVDNSLDLKYADNVETEFDKHIDINGYKTHILRENGDTTIIIMGLNFLGKYSGDTLFALTTDAEWVKKLGNSPNRKVIPKLNELSYAELVTLAKQTVLNYKQGKYEWDYEHRCNIYK